MPFNTENVNEFSLTGRVSYKNYDADERRLRFVVAVLIPRLNRAKKEGEDFYADFPGFVLEGEEAEKWNAKMERGTRLTIRGHLESSRQQEWAGRNYYKLVNVIVPSIEEMNETQGLVMRNYVRLKGRVSRVRAGEGERHYYIITIRTELEDGRHVSVPCFYFDPRMTLDPHAGDDIDIEGVVSTRRAPLEFDKTRTGVRLSVVIQGVNIERVSEGASVSSAAKPKVNITPVAEVVIEGDEVNALDADEPAPKPITPEELISEVEEGTDETPSSETEDGKAPEEKPEAEEETPGDNDDDLTEGDPVIEAPADDDMPVIADDEFDKNFDSD